MADKRATLSRKGAKKVAAQTTSVCFQTKPLRFSLRSLRLCARRLAFDLNSYEIYSIYSTPPVSMRFRSILTVLYSNQYHYCPLYTFG